MGLSFKVEDNLLGTSGGMIRMRYMSMRCFISNRLGILLRMLIVHSKEAEILLLVESLWLAMNL